MSVSAMSLSMSMLSSNRSITCPAGFGDQRPGDHGMARRVQERKGDGCVGRRTTWRGFLPLLPVCCGHHNQRLCTSTGWTPHCCIKRLRRLHSANLSQFFCFDFAGLVRVPSQGAEGTDHVCPHGPKPLHNPPPATEISTSYYIIGNCRGQVVRRDQQYWKY